MIFRITLLLLLAVFNPVFADIDNKNINENQLQDLFKSLRCLVCEGQSVYESEADFAIEVRKKSLSLAKSGKNKKEIQDYFVSVYGEDVLIIDQINNGNFVIWIIPKLLIIMLLYFTFKHFRQNLHNNL